MPEVRIIGGMWKGRKLRFPDTTGLRPTLARARETLFNWLRTDICGARCLDLYAGSGALGFEALSQGAAHVTFVDCSRVVTRALRKNSELLNAQSRIVTGHAQRFLARAHATEEPWNLIFLDPPFASDELQPCLAALETATYLADDALVYFEQSKRDAPPDNGSSLSLGGCWRTVKITHAGDSAFGLLARA